ncbi:MAG: HAMP domain-containing protein [Gammaproteobacteria bacterium]|nr:HAMP domain-containing protein [Gammaproteobacteria bacterium]
MRGMASAAKKSLTRLLLGHELIFLLLIVITAVLGGGWVYLWHQASQESVRINSLLYEAQQLRADLYRQVREIQTASSARDPTALDLYWRHIYNIDRSFYRLESYTRNVPERQAVRGMRHSYEMMQAEINQLLATPNAVAESTRQRVIEPAYESWLEGAFEKAFHDFKQLIGKREAELRSRLSLANRTAAWVLPLPLLLALVLLIYSHRNLREHFSRPMRELEQGAQQIRIGELQHRVTERGAAEVSQLAGTINQMANDLAVSRDTLVKHERNAALGSLVPVVAHNIRNPLASIRATAQTLDHGDDESELIESKRAIIATVDRLERWVSSLLSYLNPLEPHRRSGRLCTIVDGALSLLKTPCAAKEVTVEKSGWDDNERVSVDSDLLEQAIHGLLLNALEAVPKHSVMRLTIESNAHQVALVIEDRGPGIAFDPDPKGLMPGPTTKRSGTGLGIPFAYKVCEVHGGSLSFEPRDAGGTKTCIALPRETQSNAA